MLFVSKTLRHVIRNLIDVNQELVSYFSAIAFQ